MWKMNLLAALFCAAVSVVAYAQEDKPKKVSAAEPPVVARCDRERALSLIDEQLNELKVFEQRRERISLLVKAAEILWAFDEERSRGILKQSYELASDFVIKEAKEPPPAPAMQMFNRSEDPRLAVVRAVARKDAAWAKLLSERMVEEMKEAQQLKAETDVNNSQTGDNLLSIANSVVKTDQNLALTLARQSLQYNPSSYFLVFFLYDLAEVDQAAANQFLLEAIQAFSVGQTRSLLGLTAYVFAQPRSIGAEGFSFYRGVPEKFQPPAAGQQQFLEALLNRAASFATAPPLVDETQYVSETASLYLALQQLEGLVAKYQPGYLPRLGTAKVTLSALLSERDRKQTAEMTQQQHEMETDTSESILDRAEKEVDADEKDRLISNAVTAKGSTENPERIESLIRKVSDLDLRKQLLSYFFFTRATIAIEKGQLDEAVPYLEGVDELDLRAYLAMQIATERIKKTLERQRAKDVLEPVISLSLRSSDSAAKAKALFGLTYLYAKLDTPRAFSVMDEAVRTVNNIDGKLLAESGFMREVKGKKFMSFSMYSIPGYTLENTFLGLEGHDFDAALSTALKLSDKSLRTSVVLALAEKCLEADLAEKKRQEALKKAARKPQGKLAAPAPPREKRSAPPRRD